MWKIRVKGNSGKPKLGMEKPLNKIIEIGKLYETT
jgi:hypothetical protein